MPKTYVEEYLVALVELLQELSTDAISQLIGEVKACRDRGGTVYVLGNGGSAATASHLAVDLGKGASLGADRRFKVMSLADNVSWLTALANDLSYKDVFAEQLANFISDKDLVIGFSVSGNSENVLRAVRLATSVGCRTVGVTGQGGELSRLADLVIHVPSRHFGRVEDVHMVIAHIVCYYFMERGGQSSVKE